MQPTSHPSTTLTKRQLAAVSVGNAFEWYDFTVYAYLAVELGKAFFPREDAFIQLLSAFAVFAVAYFFRPLGGIVFGRLGDRIGRKWILTVIVLLMGLSTAVVGLLPGFAQIGIVAPVVLVLLRVVQGLSAGGEYGGAASYLIESTPARKRAWYLSLVPATSYVGILFGSLMIIALRSGLSPAAFAEWGWRVPFLIALPGALAAAWMRRGLNESTEFAELKETGQVEKSPLLNALRHDWRSILQVIGLMVALSYGTYVIMVYLQSYLSTVGTLDPTTAQWVISAVLLAGSIALPFVGRLSDRIGRKPTMLLSLGLLFALSIPGFWILQNSGVVLALLTSVVLAVVFVTYQISALTAMTEVFTTSRRLSGFNVGYNLSIALFAGPTPYLAASLVLVTGIKIAPAFLVTLAAVISALTVLTMKESAPAIVEPTLARHPRPVTSS